MKEILTYFDFKFFIKFLLLFVPLYYFHIYFRGITDPQNTYSPFLDNNLNYISWATSSILNTSNIINHVCGFNTVVYGKIIKVFNGQGLIMEPPCVGLGIISFWIAFVVASKINIKAKVYWTLLGIIAIWLINSVRVSILLFALSRHWQVNKFISHHDLFNLIAYSIITLLVLSFPKTTDPPLSAKY